MHKKTKSDGYSYAIDPNTASIEAWKYFINSQGVTTNFIFPVSPLNYYIRHSFSPQVKKITQ